VIPSTEAFSLDNGADQLRVAFRDVTCILAENAAPVALTDATVAGDYVASTADHYQPQTARPWPEIVDDVRRSVQQVIDDSGAFIVRGSTGAFVCT